MTTSDFIYPTFHSYGMLNNYKFNSNTSESEEILIILLKNCLDNNDLEYITETKHRHDELVKSNLLEEISNKKYKLTKKSLGLLYSYYHS